MVAMTDFLDGCGAVTFALQLSRDRRASLDLSKLNHGTWLKMVIDVKPKDWSSLDKKGREKGCTVGRTVGCTTVLQEQRSLFFRVRVRDAVWDGF